MLTLIAIGDKLHVAHEVYPSGPEHAGVSYCCSPVSAL